MNPDGLRSPHNGRPLYADGPHSLTDGERRYPIIDRIPFLRTGREALAAAALAALDANEPARALTLLLGDRDEWATTPQPEPAALRALVAGEVTTYRAALTALAFGPTATYLAHRWSDPTFVAGLGLLAAHAPAPGVRTLEIACGTGPYLRELLRCGSEATGGDVVFSKLWLARRYIAPDARLVCFDAAAPWPFADGAFGYVHCHDAFYFLPRKSYVAAEMRRLAGTAGTIAISHAHNAAIDNFSAGEALRVAAYAALFPGAVLYDDRELADALAARREPRRATAQACETAAAIALVADPQAASRSNETFALPAAGTRLVRNPLYESRESLRARVRWPSQRYEREYADLATYPLETAAPPHAVMGESARVTAWALTRELVALPVAW